MYSFRGEKCIGVLEGLPLEDIVDIEESLSLLYLSLAVTPQLNSPMERGGKREDIEIYRKGSTPDLSRQI